MDWNRAQRLLDFHQLPGASAAAAEITAVMDHGLADDLEDLLQNGVVQAG
ncbi:MAG: hypothetical protein ABIS50_20540 [Luteolibacter sp.]